MHLFIDGIGGDSEYSCDVYIVQYVYGFSCEDIGSDGEYSCDIIVVFVRYIYIFLKVCFICTDRW